MPGPVNTGRKCEACGRAVMRYIWEGRVHGHADGLNLFCTPTCAMAFAIAAHMLGCRFNHKRRWLIRQLRDPMIALSLIGSMHLEPPTRKEDLPNV